MGLRGDILAIAEAFRDAFELPGLAIAAVRPDEAPLVEGIGVRVLGEAGPVGVDTQFAIASNSKAFLAASLAIEVDRGHLGWDEPVIKYLPEFRMADPAVTRMMTVRDLLVHRSGLPLGAGDLMTVRKGDFAAADLIAALEHFAPENGFRAGYAYDNILYIVAGEVLERVSGLHWNDYLAREILTPLAMRNAAPNPSFARAHDRAGRHARLGPPVIGLGPLERIVPDETDLLGPAGGMQASASDILPWLQVQLAEGALPDGRRLWSADQADEMWRPQTIIASGPGPTAEMPQRAVIESYALGWGVNDYRRHRMLTHAGLVAGQSSRIALLPDAGIGLAVFSNCADSEPLSALRYALLDLLIGAEPFDWVGHARRTIKALTAQVAAIAGDGTYPVPPGGPSLPLECYAGRYRDPWYGEIEVTHGDRGLHLRFVPTPAFAGPLDPFGPDSFRTHFPRGAGEDAVLTFVVEGDSVTGVTARALSPLADFSFDYHHLAFVPVLGGT